MEANVLEAAKQRVAECFRRYDNVIVSFSGGKDSGVVLNLAYDYARDSGQLHKIVIVNVDYEANYQYTIDHITSVMSGYPGVNKFWLCLPIAAQCAVNMTNPGLWYPWDEADRDKWVRDIPDNPHVITSQNVPFPFRPHMTDNEAMEALHDWWAAEHGSTVVLIGIRADESYHRRRLILLKKGKIDGLCWLHQDVQGKTPKAFPVYDWKVEDIWTAYAKFGWSYNHLYDLFYQAGMRLNDMRVASPFNDCATDNLRYYKCIDPNMWGKMVSRVNGVNFAGIYGGTTAMGWRRITKPEHFTWQEYAEFLLNTLPPDTQENYRTRLATSLKSWRKGGYRDQGTIAQLMSIGADFERTGDFDNGKERIRMDGYLDDAPIKDFRLVPSWKRLCVCILKNDWYCKYMGFAQTKNDIKRRKEAIEKWSNIL